MFRCLVIAAFWFSVTVAQAQEIAPSRTEQRYFDWFDQFCLATLGAPEAAQAAAAEAGWPSVPEEIIAQVTTPDAPIVSGRYGPSLIPSGAPIFFFSATGPPVESGLVAHTCVFDPGNLPRMDAATLEAMVTRRLGIEPRQTALGPIWSYSGTGPYVSEERVWIEDEVALATTTQRRPIALVQIKVHEGRPYLNLTRAGR